MTDQSKQQFDENDIRRWVQELPSAEPDPVFRERLRSAFVSGQVKASQAEERRISKERSPIRWWRWVVLAGAVAVLLLMFIGLNRTPGLAVFEAAGAGDALVDGHPIALDDVNALEVGVRARSEIEVPPEGSIDLVANEVVLFEITGGTRMTIPQMPGRWFGRAVACSLFVGELRIKTGDRFQGSELRVFTPEGIVEIAGTLLSVQRYSGGTCVCVLEGVAYVGVDDDDLEPVEPGYRKVMLRDGAAKIIPVEPTHRDGVLDFDRRVGQQIRYER